MVQLREGGLDYDVYMHYHGHNAYPAGFLYTYNTLLSLTSGHIASFQILWALLEILTVRAVCMYIYVYIYI